MTPNYLFIILCFIIIFAVFIMMVAVEVLEAEEFIGCAESVDCTDSLIAWDRKNGGVDYYGRFDSESREYIHSLCTLLPEKCGKI